MDYLGRLEGIVRDGQKAHCIRRDLDPRVVAVMFLGIVQPVGILWFLSDGRFDATRQARRAWKILSEAIAVPPEDRRIPGARARRVRPRAGKEG